MKAQPPMEEQLYLGAEYFDYAIAAQLESNSPLTYDEMRSIMLDRSLIQNYSFTPGKAITATETSVESNPVALLDNDNYNIPDDILLIGQNHILYVVRQAFWRRLLRDATTLYRLAPTLLNEPKVHESSFQVPNHMLVKRRVTPLEMFKALMGIDS